MDILPKDISRWTVTKGSIDNNTIKLDAGGTAVVYIEQRDIVELPSNATLQLMVSRYSNGYTPNIYIDITVDTSFHQRINCVDNRGLVHVEIDLPEGSYTNFKIEVFTDTSVELTNMSLIVPTLPLEELLTDIREELPRILSYENRYKFSVGQIESPIGVISLRLMETASVNGHLQINFTATEASTIILRFYTDEVVELYAPSTYRIQPGWNSIGIPHAYLYKAAGLHTMYVTAQVSVGEIIFEPNDVLYTIDGGRLASRTIDVGFDVRDITMRRLDPYGNPSYVFAAGIDEGHALIRGREYSQEYALAWEPVSDLGPANDIRIESDGRWVQTDIGYRYATYEYPAVTVLRNNGDLEYIDLNGVISTRIIAEDVTYHSMVRGYNNISFEERDQGMLIAYVKDSKAYYRNLLVLDNVVVVRPERQLLEDVTNVTRVNATRLNDYRLAIVVETDSINYLMVTERNWAGIAIAPSKLTAASIEIGANLIPVKYTHAYTQESLEAAPATLEVDLRYASTDNKFIEVYNEPMTLIDENNEEYEDWGKVLIFTTKHDLYNISASSFELEGSHGSYFPDTIQEISPRTYKVTFEDANNFNNAGDSPTLKYTQGSTVNGVGVVYDVFEKQFDAVNLVPIAIPLPEVEAIWNE